MNLWTKENWKKVLNYPDNQYRHGLRLRFDTDVNNDLKEQCKVFAIWLRQKFFFPIRVPIYFKNKKKLLCKDGDLAFGTCFLPYSYDVEPYIRIAVGDYDELCAEWGKTEATLAVLKTISHELSHYFQWLNNEHLTSSQEERQAKYYANYILRLYIDENEILF